jgi:Asp-tRNA(Asn)/Glu-tRNA(Gln) amidotransferase A subunit family amidase
MPGRTLSVSLAALLFAAVPIRAQHSPPGSAQAEAASALMGLTFDAAERDSMMDELGERLQSYAGIRSVPLANAVPPSLVFNPLPPGFTPDRTERPFRPAAVQPPPMPPDLEDLAFASVGELAALLRSRRVTSEQLTRMYLGRLKKYGPKLECVVTLMEERALERARRADREIAAGKYRGPLHGVPYGAKDLLAARGAPTTWGSVPYKEQVIDEDATVIRRLEEAGAVLVAKLTLGELAWGDVWFGGKTRNPWKLEQGSSGSSAGSASATAAGLVPFAIGSETWGSIVSPSTRCGTTGLRPTFGRVSRAGAMALSWSMDKIGPICRTVDDCALVLEAIRGADGDDPAVVNAPFGYDAATELRGLTIGVVQAEFDSADTAERAHNEAALAVLRSLGAELVPITLPTARIGDLSLILSAEAAAAFDELTRSGRDDLLVRQIKNAWPNVFRAARFIPAVEYIQANRIRTLLIRDMAKVMERVDLFVAPPFGDNLLLTNLTGHPCVVLPHGFSREGTPVSITFTGRLFDEGKLLAVARRYQEATEFHRRHPVLP